MKKTLFSLLFVLIGFVAQVNAQIYTEPVQRNKGELTRDGTSSGTLYMSTRITSVKVVSRSNEVFSRTLTTGHNSNETIGYDASNGADFYYEITLSSAVSKPLNGSFGVLAISYKDLTPENKRANVLAGQEVKIKCECAGKVGFANAVMYIDWDGNGVFDDHDPNLYNLYGLSSSAVKEYNGVEDTWGSNGMGVKPEWTIKVPETFNTAQNVRVRIRVSEAVQESLKNRFRAIGSNGDVVTATNNKNNALNTMKQYFYSSNLFAFMPSGAFSNGQTFDFEMHIEPDTYSPMQVKEDTHKFDVRNEVGGASGCGVEGEIKATGTSISSETDYVNWINNTNRKSAYLLNDITLTNKVFTAEIDNCTLDGNGFTIKITGSADVEDKSRDACFYPYGEDATTLAADSASYDFAEDKFVVPTHYPEYNIAGGLFGKLGANATVKNLKVNVDAAGMLYTGNDNMIFGLVAGISRGRIENVKVELNGAVQVTSTKYDRPWAVGGLTGILYRGVVKNCEVDINNSVFVVEGTGNNNLQGESCLGGFIGRLQGGIVGNVKFSGETNARLTLRANPSLTYARYYIGGIAGMTNTPKAVFCGKSPAHQLYWGYDNGSTGLDVNNVIVNFQGNLDMHNPNNSGSTHLYYCRGLLFGEATDTITVPVVVAQGASSFTIEEDASTANGLIAPQIPFTSRTKGIYNADQKTGTPTYLGKLYLYRDGRIPGNDSKCNKYTVVTANDTELNWGYASESVTKTDGSATSTSCVTYYQPYIVATYTGQNPETIQSIEGATSTATFGGKELNGSTDAQPWVKLDPDPATATTATWTWSTTTPPPPSDIVEATCGGQTQTVVTEATISSVNTNMLTYQDGSQVYTIDNVKDGNYDTKFWSWENQAAGNYVRVDLGQECELDRIELFFNTGDKPLGGQIQISNDEEFTSPDIVASFVKDDIGDASTNYLYSCSATGKKARYVRFYNTNPNTGWFQLHDIKVYIKTVVPAGSGSGGSAPATLANPFCTTSAQLIKNTLNSLTATGGTEEFALTGQQTDSNSPVYQDLTASNVLKAKAGNTITFTSKYRGSNGMHGFLYVDYDSNGTFSVPNEMVINTGTADSRITDGSSSPYTYTYTPFTIPSDLAVGDYRVRFKIDWSSTDPCGTENIGSNGGYMIDFVLRVEGDGGTGGNTGPTPVYCETNLEFDGNTAPIKVPDNVASKILNAENLTVVVDYTVASSVSSSTSTTQDPLALWGAVNSSATSFASGTANYLAGVLWDRGNSFGGGVRYNDYGGWLTQNNDNLVGSNKKYVVVMTQAQLRTYLNGTAEQTTNDATGYVMTFPEVTGADEVYIGGLHFANGTNKFQFTGTINSIRFYDKALSASEIAALDYNNPCPAPVVDGCYYEYDFGEVWMDKAPITREIKIDVVPENLTDADTNDSFECTYNIAEGKLIVTFNPTDADTYDVPAAYTFKVGDVDYQINLKGSAKNAPRVEWRIASTGGGQLSNDFGRTLLGSSKVFEQYRGEVITAVPVGPTKLVKWERSYNGTDWEEIASIEPSGMISPDWQYQGTQNAILRATFDFKEYEGDFGLAKFTDATTQPYFIKSIKTTGALININADGIFSETIEAGSERYKLLPNQGIQTKPSGLGEQEIEVTVTMEHMENFNSEARLMCFLDYNGNGYFDFSSSDDAKAEKLQKNGELVFIGRRHTDGLSGGLDSATGSEYTYSESERGTDPDNKIGTFTFKLSNTDIVKYVFGRIRFIAATYVDAYGLGPVNQYGNYQPRISENEVTVGSIALNDNNGSRFSPNNHCHIESYVNAVDAIFDVVLYLKAEDGMSEDCTKVIGDSEMTRMGYIYIESVEDERGIHSGKLVFDNTTPNATGSIQLNGSILVKKRIYKDRWHHIAFPFDVYGEDGYVSDADDHRIKVYTETGEITPIDPDSWVAYKFSSHLRNEDNGYGNAAVLVDDKSVLQADTFYYFAADPVALDKNKTVKTEKVTIEGKEVEYFWVLFHSKDRGWDLNAKQAQPVTKTFKADQNSTQYNNRNVFVFGNPYLSPVNVRDISLSAGVDWHNITWWNAANQRHEPVSAYTNMEMPPYYGYWVQFTEVDNYTHGVSDISITFGNPDHAHNKEGEHSHITFKSIAAPNAFTSTFDMPDSYTIGIDREEDSNNKKAISRTIVTLTNAGNVNEMRAGYDMPVSYAVNSTVPEIWSKAGASRMMFNDVRREDEVTVPLGIRIKEAGEYVIRLTDTNSPEALVQLRDLQTGAIVELQRDGSNYIYSFLADKGDSERFELVIGAPKMVTDLDVVELTDETADMLIYKSGDVLRLQHVPVGYSVEVCDVVGREVLSTTVTDDDMQVRLPDAQGVYLVRVRNAQGVQQQVIKLTR